MLPSNLATIMWSSCVAAFTSRQALYLANDFQKCYLPREFHLWGFRKWVDIDKSGLGSPQLNVLLGMHLETWVVNSYRAPLAFFTDNDSGKININNNSCRLLHIMCQSATQLRNVIKCEPQPPHSTPQLLTSIFLTETVISHVHVYDLTFALTPLTSPSVSSFTYMSRVQLQDHRNSRWV